MKLRSYICDKCHKDYFDSDFKYDQAMQGLDVEFICEDCTHASFWDGLIGCECGAHKIKSDLHAYWCPVPSKMWKKK